MKIAEQEYRDTEAAIRAAGGPLLTELRHFDSFRMKDGQRSFAFHTLLRAPERTLTAEDEQGFIAKVAGAAKGLGGGATEAMRLTKPWKLQVSGANTYVRT